jgi:protein TonB
MVPRAALAISVFAHVGAVAFAAGHGDGTSAVAREAAPARLELIEIAAPPAELSTTAAPSVVPVSRATRRAARPPSHHHDYPVAPDHDRHPHDPSEIHAPLAPPAIATPEPAEPVHFTLAASTFVTREPLAKTAGAPAERAHEEPGDRETLDASDVTTSATLLSGAPIVYPPAARAAEVEADVAVEIVVDALGRVVEAKPLRASGYGLDEAAVRAVARYRFRPAARDGRPVRVRMPWLVQFRLR